MMYKNYDSNKLQRHERKDKAKWIIAFTCIILLIVAVGVIAFSVYFDSAYNKPTDVVAEPQDNTKGAIMPMSSAFSKTATVKAGIPEWGPHVGVSSMSSTDMANLPLFLDSRTGQISGSFDYTAKVINFTNSGYNSSPYTTNTILLVDDLNNLSFPALTSNGSTFNVNGSNYVKTTFADSSTQSFSLSFSSLDTSKNYYALYIGHQIVGYGQSNYFYVNVWGLVNLSMVEVPDAPTKTGYTFTGWYTDEDCTHLYTDEYVSSDITLYAGWRANTYKVVFNGNGAGNTMSSQSMTYDTSVNLTKNTFSRTGYNFLGWSTSADGDVVYTDGQSIKNLTATNGATITLYAVWEAKVFTVTFMVDGNVYKTIEVTYGTKLSDLINSNVAGIVYTLSATNELPSTVTDDMSIDLVKTSLGTYITQDWVIYTAIAVGALAVIGILVLIINKVKKPTSNKF